MRKNAVQNVSNPSTRGPVSSVHAMTYASPAITQHVPADPATVRQNRRTGPSPCSVPAHAATTASIMPGQNQIQYRATNVPASGRHAGT
ncbi:hypothetical protein GCM10009677_14620 [Sphaerisporangium rubeum]